jgi:hypothetical protein
MDAKNIGLAFMAVILAGCASPMPENEYADMASFAGMFERCYEARYVDYNLHSQTLAAYQLLLRTWSYDRQKFTSHVTNAYNASSPNYGSCQRAEVRAHQVIAEARQHQVSQQAAHQAIYQAKKTPLFCTNNRCRP